MLRELDDPVGGRAAVRELVRAGYLEAVTDVEQSDVPVTVRPSLIGLQLLAGWPGSSGEAALAGLVNAIDIAIASGEDTSKKARLTQLRDGLLGVGKDVALAYLEKKAGVA